MTNPSTKELERHREEGSQSASNKRAGKKPQLFLKQLKKCCCCIDATVFHLMWESNKGKNQTLATAEKNTKR